MAATDERETGNFKSASACFCLAASSAGIALAALGPMNPRAPAVQALTESASSPSMAVRPATCSSPTALGSAWTSLASCSARSARLWWSFSTRTLSIRRLALSGDFHSSTSNMPLTSAAASTRTSPTLAATPPRMKNAAGRRLACSPTRRPPISNRRIAYSRPRKVSVNALPFSGVGAAEPAPRSYMMSLRRPHPLQRLVRQRHPARAPPHRTQRTLWSLCTVA